MTTALVMRSGRDLPALYLPPDTDADGREPSPGKRLSVIYTRYSSDSQNESSTDRQYDDASAYEREKGLVNAGRYDDQGVSGTTLERDQLQRLRDDARLGRFTDVVVESLDRLARKIAVALQIFEELIELGITVHDVEEGRQLNIYDIGTKGAAAQQARDLLVKRAQSGIRLAAARGTFGVASCFGYHRVWKEAERGLVWEVNEDEKKIVIEIFEMFADGISAQRICDNLNSRAPGERGNRYWTRGVLVGDAKLGTGILRRLRYIGVRVHGRVKLTKKAGKYQVGVHKRNSWVVGELEKKLAIVEKELFDRVAHMLNNRAEAAAAARASAPRYYSAKKSPLRGKIFCIHCGSTMTPTQKRKDGKPRLLCNKARTKQGCTNGRSFKLDAVEDETHRLLLENLGTDQGVLPYVQTYNSSAVSRVEDAAEKKRRLEKDRQNAIGRLDKVREDEEGGRYPESYLKQKRQEANEEYSLVERKLAEAEALSRAAPVYVDPEKRLESHRKLMQSLGMIFSDAFDSTSETGTALLAKLRKLIHSIVLDIDEAGCTVNLKCRMVDPDDDSEANLGTFTSRLERSPSKWEASKREVRRVADVAAAGSRAVTDAEWCRIAHLVPDNVGLSKRGGVSVDKRKIVDAALLHLWEGVPLLQMPEHFGPKQAVFSGLKRLSESGGWDAVADELHTIAPDRIPDIKSVMFSTDRTKPSTGLKGLPRVRAVHGVAAAGGKHAPDDALWNKVSRLIPEQVLQVNQQSAFITPRRFLHGLLYWLCERIPMSNLPLMFGSYTQFNHAIGRLAGHGHLDELIEALQSISPDMLKDANLKLLDRFARSTKEVSIWRRALPKRSDLDGIPDHLPDEKVWNLIQHLFPVDILFFKDEAVIRSPRIFAHAILYRIKEKIPCSVMPTYFGNPKGVQRCLEIWVFHHLWEEFVRVLSEHAPDVLVGADLSAFDHYKRGRSFRYRDLINSERLPAPAHLPSEADFAIFEDLIPIEVLAIRGGPAIMEPRQFFHAVVYMLREHTLFGGLPPYFGKTNDVRTAARRFVRHHYWERMSVRIQHFQPEWAKGADLTIFDSIKRSDNFEPEFRRRRVRGTGKVKAAVAEARNELSNRQ